MEFTYQDVAKMIDHSLLNPTIPVAKLEEGVQIALDYDVASVCILPYYMKQCAELLKGSDVKASTTIGFPHGGHTTETKLAEARPCGKSVAMTYRASLRPFRRHSRVDGNMSRRESSSSFQSLSRKMSLPLLSRDLTAEPEMPKVRATRRVDCPSQ